MTKSQDATLPPTPAVVDAELLIRLSSVVQRHADAISAIWNEGYGLADGQWEARRKRVDAAVAAAQSELTESEGATFSHPPHGHAMRLAGIRSTSTAGFVSLLHNWRRAALVKIGEIEEAAEG